jgi:anti-anti-sigma regulatory factor
VSSPSFSLSVSSRGNDFVIGGSGALDSEGVISLRQSVEESCKKEGASVMLDLMMVSELHPDVVVHLAGVADFCRGLGVPFTVSVNHDLLKILNDSGYDAELMPLISGT